MKEINPTHAVNDEVLKVYLLQEESLIIPYQKRLSVHLKNYSNKPVYKLGRVNIVRAIKKVGHEFLGNTKKY